MQKKGVFDMGVFQVPKKKVYSDMGVFYRWFMVGIVMSTFCP